MVRMSNRRIQQKKKSSTQSIETNSNSIDQSSSSKILNVIMGLMMISIGICAALWEDKLRRTPGILKRGYLSNEYQTVFSERTHPRPGAAAAAATFALIAGILFLIEACTRPMLSTGATRLSTSDRPGYTVATNTQCSPINKPDTSERIIPIETTTSQYRV